MGRYTGPKNRISRRFGINVFSRAKNPMVKRQHGPGMHGAKRKKKSDYGIQLEEKQKLKAAFGMVSEKQLMNYFKKAAAMNKNTPEIFLQMLDMRLDNVVFRMKFGTTPFQAQQLVSHGHVLVNGKRVNIRSFHVKPGMEISVRPKSRKMQSVIDAIQGQSRSVPAYLELNAETCTGKVLALPSLQDISLPLEVNLPMICDFLAHKG